MNVPVQSAAAWYDDTPSSEAALVDRIACLANPCKYTWSDSDREEMQETARIILSNVQRFYNYAAISRGLVH